MSGIGDVMLEHLTKVPSATSKQLAKLVPEKPFATVHSRLRVLVDEGRLTLLAKAERREDWRWTLEGAPKPFVRHVPKAKAPKPEKQPKPPPEPREDGSLGFSRNHGWKPDLSSFEPLEGEVAKGDKLLVEYSEPWRDTMLCAVTKPDGYLGVAGQAQVWDLRGDCYSVVDVAGWKARGWKVARVRDAKQLAKLGEE